MGAMNLLEGEQLPSFQEILEQLEATEAFYKNNPDIQKIKIMDYITLLPRTPVDNGDSFMKFFDECKHMAVCHKVVFLESFNEYF